MGFGSYVDGLKIQILRKSLPPIPRSLQNVQLFNSYVHAQGCSSHRTSPSVPSSIPMRSKSSSSSLVNTPLPTPPSDEIVGPFSDVLAATKTFFGDPSSDRHHSMAESRDLSTRPDVPDFFLPYFGATDGREGRISGETPKTRRSQDSKGKMTMTQSPKIEAKAGSHPRLSLLSHAAGKMLFGHRLSDAIAKTPSITNFWSRRNSVPSSSGPLPTNTRHKTRARSNAFASSSIYGSRVRSLNGYRGGIPSIVSLAKQR